MPLTEHTPLPPRPREASFHPRFLLTILYLMSFFFAAALLLILPELLEVLAEVPPGPEQQEIAKQAAQRAVGPRLLPALIISVLATAAGTYLEVLPGLREQR
jgi:hypothetical protein